MTILNLRFRGPLLVAAILIIGFNQKASAQTIISVDSLGLPSTGTYVTPDVFQAEGLTFDKSYFVGFVQGHSALIFGGPTDPVGPITGSFGSAHISSISVEVAAGFQGAATYTLSALNAHSHVIDSISAAHSETGYYDIGLTGLHGASGFVLSVDSQLHSNFESGLTSITFNTAAVPDDSSTGILLTVALIALLCAWVRRATREPPHRCPANFTDSKRDGAQIGAGLRSSGFYVRGSIAPGG
jgi:hypothetical protein